MVFFGVREQQINQINRFSKYSNVRFSYYSEQRRASHFLSGAVGSLMCQRGMAGYAMSTTSVSRSGTVVFIQPMKSSTRAASRLLPQAPTPKRKLISKFFDTS